jgi:hypothetical protein
MRISLWSSAPRAPEFLLQFGIIDTNPRVPEIFTNFSSSLVRLSRPLKELSALMTMSYTPSFTNRSTVRTGRVNGQLIEWVEACGNSLV